MAEVDLGIPGLVDYQEIGAGGFATVFSAVEPEANRRVAVKVLAAMGEGGQRRFDRERRTMGQTSAHDNIVTMFRSGYTDPGHRPYLVMEHMPRGSLQDRLDNEGPLGVNEAVQTLLPVIDGLGFAHTTGIVHKDVKPANILISATGSPKLSDFGIAGIRDATGTGQMAFSLLYTPPETFDATTGPGGENTDPRDERSDIYSVAATLYTLITGTPLFWADSQAALMRMIISEPPPRTGEPSLDALLATALAKDPDDRFRTAAQLSAAFRSVQQQSGAVAPISPLTVQNTAPPLEQQQPSVELFHQHELDRQNHAAVPTPIAQAPSIGYPTSTNQNPSIGHDPSIEHAAAFGQGQQPANPSQSRSIMAPVEATQSGPFHQISGPGKTRNRRTPLLAIGTAVIAVAAVALIATIVILNNDENPISTAAESSDSTTEGPASTVEASTTVAPTTAAPTTLPEPPEPIVYSGHTGQVWSVVALSDGRVASGSPDNTVQVWDPDDPDATPVTYTGHTDTVVAVTELPDGRIASAGWGSTVHVWDPEDPDANATLYTGHSRGVEALIVLSDGRIASAATDATVQVWNPDEPGTTEATYNGHTGPLRTVAELPDGRIASASDEGTVQVWHPDDPGTTLATYASHERGVEALIALSDGRIASASDDASVHVWDPDEADLTQAIYTGHSDRVMALVQLSDGRIATSSRDTTVQVWDPDETGITHATFNGHTENVLSVDELSDRRIASASDDSTVQIWDPADH